MSTPTPPPGFEPLAFGRYFLVDRIAAGGMAEVFKAKSFAEGGFEKLLVIKRILDHLSGNAEFIDMFIDEAKISVELQHPNIVQIYDFGKIRDNYFIAMECVEGKDVKGILRKLAERRKLLPPEYAAYIAHEMLKGLDYAHKRTNLQGEHLGIIHRDISPSNILVAYSGEVKVADFGIAKAEISLYNTADGVLKGKFEYMSPEQARGGDASPQSDIFGAGIILHEMLTGRRLFKTDSEIKTLEKIKSGDYPAPSQINPSVPTRLDELVGRALHPDPEARYRDAREMQQALLDYMYPSTPDGARESLTYFMAELFSDDIEAERSRLDSGSKKAQVLWETAPELELDGEWDEGGSASTIRRAPPSGLGILMWVGAAFVALFLGAAVLFFAMTRPDPVVVEKLIEAPKPTHGSLQLKVKGPADAVKVSLDGVLVGTDPQLIYNEVAPSQDVELRLEAEGFEIWTDTVNIEAGERLRMPITMVPLPVEPTPSLPGPEQPDPEVAPEPTPEPEQVVAPEPTPEPEVQAPPPPPPPAAEPGRVSVNVKSGWAEVWIDGKKVDTTPLFNHKLKAGKHTIKVVNPSSGFEASKTVDVPAGEVVRVNF